MSNKAVQVEQYINTSYDTVKAVYDNLAQLTQLAENLAIFEAIKPPVLVVTDASITLFGIQTIKSVTVAEGDRVLVTSQNAGVENGIYIASTVAWARSTDWDANSEVKSGMLICDTDETVLYKSSFTGDFDITSTVVTFIQFLDVTVNEVPWTRDTAANWTALNTVIASGIGGIESDTGHFKLGDGSTAWNSLGYSGFATKDSNNNIIMGTGSGGSLASNGTVDATVIGNNALAGTLVQNIDGIIAIGDGVGAQVTGGTGSILIGQNAGPATPSSISNSLWISNTETDTPLIHGAFNTRDLLFNIQNGSYTVAGATVKFDCTSFDYWSANPVLTILDTSASNAGNAVVSIQIASLNGVHVKCGYHSAANTIYEIDNTEGPIELLAGSSNGGKDIFLNGEVHCEQGFHCSGLSYSITAGTKTLVLNLANHFYAASAMTAVAYTFAFSLPPPSGRTTEFIVEIEAGSSASSITWPASVQWSGGSEPVWTANTDLVKFYSRDQGTIWHGVRIISNSS